MTITNLKGFNSPCVVLSGRKALEMADVAYQEAKPGRPLGVLLRIVEHAFDLEGERALQAGGVVLSEREAPPQSGGGFEIS